MRGDGDGWVLCGSSHRHWGRYGAAGLLQAALREASEEARIAGSDVRVAGMWRDDHGRLEVRDRAGDGRELRWVPVAEVDKLDLHPGFARAWPAISAMLPWGDAAVT